MIKLDNKNYVVIGSTSKINSLDSGKRIILESESPINIYDTICVPLKDEEKDNIKPYFYYYLLIKEDNSVKIPDKKNKGKYNLIIEKPCSIHEAKQINEYTFCSEIDKKEIYKVKEYDWANIWSKKVIQISCLLIFIFVLWGKFFDKKDQSNITLFMITYAVLLEILSSFPKIKNYLAVISAISVTSIFLSVLFRIMYINNYLKDNADEISSVMTIIIVIFQIYKIFLKENHSYKEWKKIWDDNKKKEVSVKRRKVKICDVFDIVKSYIVNKIGRHKITV